MAIKKAENFNNETHEHLGSAINITMHMTVKNTDTNQMRWLTSAISPEYGAGGLLQSSLDYRVRPALKRARIPSKIAALKEWYMETM